MDKEDVYKQRYINIYTHTHTYIHTMECDSKICIYIMKYYSAMRKMEILLFVTTWIDLKDILLSEVSQTEKDK